MNITSVLIRINSLINPTRLFVAGIHGNTIESRMFERYFTKVSALEQIYSNERH
jgi:hypothetical protein